MHNEIVVDLHKKYKNINIFLHLKNLISILFRHNLLLFYTLTYINKEFLFLS